MSEYRYYIATAGSPLTSWTEFYSTDEIEATKALYEEQKFSREELSNFKIQKSRNDNLYSTLETWFADSTKFSNEIGIEVYRGARTAGDLYFKGFASVSDMKHEAENGWFEIIPRLDDDYREILALADTEYDVKGVLTGQDVIYTASYTLGNWTNGGAKKYSAYDTFGNGAPTAGLIATAIDTGANVQECYITVGETKVDEVYIFTVTNFAKNAGVNPFINIWYSAGVGAGTSLTTGEVEITGNGEYCLTIDTAQAFNAYISVFSSRVAGAICDYTLQVAARKAEAINNNVGIVWMDFLERFLTSASFMNLSFTGKVKSTFFNSDSIPTAGPATGFERYAGDTFVVSETELFCDAETNDFKVSFNDIMSDVAETLRAFWYIDESDNLRVEHESWFERIFLESTGIILTSSTYEKYRPFTDAQEYTFNKALLSNREQFSWPQFGIDINFPGVDIIYNELETVDNVLKHELGRVTTDITYVVDNVADASGDGYFFLDCATICSYYEVQSEAGLYFAPSKVNNHFAWGNLHANYWTWNRMSQSGNMNAAATSFNSAVRFLEQSVTFGYQSTLDIFERVITPRGDGFQVETIRNLDTDFLTIKLGYDPYA